jgi:hypothetical protein
MMSVGKAGSPLPHPASQAWTPTVGGELRGGLGYNTMAKWSPGSLPIGPIPISPFDLICEHAVPSKINSIDSTAHFYMIRACNLKKHVSQSRVNKDSAHD